MKKFRLGVVGLGHRGRGMFKGVAKGIGDFEAAAGHLLPVVLYSAAATVAAVVCFLRQMKNQ